MEINIEEEQRKVKDKINLIHQSGIYNRIEGSLQTLNGDFRNHSIENIAMAGRVKKAESAAEKIARQNLPASEMFDLIGFMLVVDLPEEYAKARDVMKDRMPEGSYIHDFDGSLPENKGYSSYHMGVKISQLLEGDIDPELSGLSAEVQLKSYGMYIAQEATHDSIYKSPDLTKENKDALQTVMFPLIEKIVNKQKYEQRLDFCSEEQRGYYQERIDEQNQDILKIKLNNKNFIDSNLTTVDNILKEFLVVQYVEKSKMDPTLSMSTRDVRSLCENAVNQMYISSTANYMSNTEPTGFKNIDELYGKIMGMSLEDLKDIQQTQEQQKEGIVAGISDFANLDESVTPEMRKSMVAEISHAMAERTTDRDMGTERE